MRRTINCKQRKSPPMKRQIQKLETSADPKACIMLNTFTLHPSGLDSNTNFGEVLVLQSSEETYRSLLYPRKILTDRRVSVST